MASQAQIDANRRNALKSSGPKTENGKARARCNALKHGRRAKTVTPVLPQEDPKELASRIEQWMADLQPRNDVERELVGRAARLSFVLERGERAETAHLARRVRRANSSLAGASAKRLEQVAELARKLLYHHGPTSGLHGDFAWLDIPAVFLRGLEESPEGCRWLLDRWLEFRNLQAASATWTMADQHRFIRLLGKKGVEAINDPELNRIFLAWEVIAEGTGRKYWQACWEAATKRDPGKGQHQVWREIVPRPADIPAAKQVLDTIIERQISRLEGLLAEHASLAGIEAAERADRAAFDGSVEFDRLRRCQTARGRELLRTLDVLMKMRKEEEAAPVGPVGLADPAQGSVESGRTHGGHSQPYEELAVAPVGPVVPADPAQASVENDRTCGRQSRTYEEEDTVPVGPVAPADPAQASVESDRTDGRHSRPYKEEEAAPVGPVVPADPARGRIESGRTDGRHSRPDEQEAVVAPVGPDQPAEPAPGDAESGLSACSPVLEATVKKRPIEANVESMQVARMKDVAARSQSVPGNERTQIRARARSSRMALPIVVNERRPITATERS